MPSQLEPTSDPWILLCHNLGLRDAFGLRQLWIPPPPSSFVMFKSHHSWMLTSLFSCDVFFVDCKWLQACLNLRLITQTLWGSSPLLTPPSMDAGVFSRRPWGMAPWEDTGFRGLAINQCQPSKQMSSDEECPNGYVRSQGTSACWPIS